MILRLHRIRDIHHDRTKHINIDKHFIKEKIDTSVILLKYVPIKKQTADLFTEPNPKTLFDQHQRKLGMSNIHQLKGECDKRYCLIFKLKK